MSFPSFVNAGAITQASTVHTGALPASRVNGNVLLLYFKVRSTTNDPTLSAGWTLLDSFGYGGSTYRYGVASCFVTGSEAAPTLTWAGGGTAVSEIMQYTGTDQSSPLVAGSKNGAQTGTTASNTAITSTRNGSIAISAIWNDQSTAHPLPSGFTNEGTGAFQNAFGSLRLSEVQIATSGSSSGAVSSAHASSGAWGSFLFEMKSPLVNVRPLTFATMGMG
ncbi:hypothetical protein ACVWYH_009215 [Bradyrhizobium sp. GM24.11]